ncbi:UNVERIFIED_ORG: hypothetical protein J2W38_006252 [Variovorax paradoxus]|jgi:hypothetical protein|nr:hypothetical protein [Variovorax paradoxus]
MMFFSGWFSNNVMVTASGSSSPLPAPLTGMVSRNLIEVNSRKFYSRHSRGAVLDHSSRPTEKETCLQRERITQCRRHGATSAPRRAAPPREMQAPYCKTKSLRGWTTIANPKRVERIQASSIRNRIQSRPGLKPRTITPLAT